MIASLTGTVASRTVDGVVLQVGGMGLALHLTPTTLAGLTVGEPATLATSLIVREDSLTLYGFASDDERVLFELLQTASGVGPRVAQAALAVHRPDALRRAIATEDVKALCLVTGIGLKGAQRIVLELKDKIGAVGGVAGAPQATGWRDTLAQALVGLGFPPSQADEAVLTLAQTHPTAGEAEIPLLLREGMALLGRSR